MKSVVDEFIRDKEKILGLFDRLVELRFLPCKLGNTTISAEYIATQKKNLNEEKFIISVCGQIKAGKSTLLNYMLFGGEDVIPTDDTPWTAKLTEIKHGKKDHIKVTFYSRNEWAELKTLTFRNEIEGTPLNYFNEFLKSEVDRMADDGIFERDFIRNSAHTISTDDLTELKHYVSREGRYTPFVSKVEVALNNEFIKDVVIVDTPGLNDPNELRSRITGDWIKHSNAVIMLFYVSQPLQKSDLDFIDTYLTSIPPEKHVFAISKIDLQSEFRQAKDYVETNLKNNKLLKDRHLLEDGTVYPISTMAALISHKLEANIGLSKDEEYYYRRCIKKGFSDLLKAKGYLDDFIRGIEKNLMQDKGLALLKDAKQKIRSICISKINEIEFDLEMIRQKEKKLMLSIKQLEDKKLELKNIEDDIKAAELKFQRLRNNELKKINNEIFIKINRNLSGTQDEIAKWLDRVSKIEAVKLTGHTVRKYFTRDFLETANSLLGEDLEQRIKQLKDDYVADLKVITRRLQFGYIEPIFQPVISLGDILNLLMNKIKALGPEQLEKLRERVLGFLWEKSSDTKSNILNAIDQFFDRIKNELQEILGASLQAEVTAYFENIEMNMKRHLDGYSNQLNEILNQSADKKQSQEDCRKAVLDMEMTLSEYTGAYRNIEEALGG
jgi:hypothetical protein